jgi:pimeloyl-ACP methyl ester carboxylesterase
MKKSLFIITAVIIFIVVALPVYMKKDLLPFDDEARALAPYQTVKLEDGYVHYRRVGVKGGQPIILIHGLSTPLFVWNGIIDDLAAAGMDVIAYDIYGRGWSDRPDVTNDSTLFDRQLDQLIVALKLEQPVDILGISLGCLVAARYVESHPDNVRKVGLVSPAGYVTDLPLVMQLMRTPVLGSWLMDVAGKKALLSGISKYQFEDSPIPDLLERYEQMMSYEGCLSSVSNTMINFNVDAATDSYKVVGQTGKPVQVFWGTADKTTPYKSSTLLQRDIPQADIYTVEAGTHAIVISHDDEIAKVLVEFLQE